MPDHPTYKTILLFGAPGAGKGTQGAILGRIPGFYHCSCGDVFRNIDISTELGRKFYEYSSRGELVPDEITVQMWARAIHARTILGDYKPAADLLILDGIPRTLEQACIMDEHIEVLKIIHLTCSDEEAMFERLRRRALKSNRHDDADEKVIRHRWEVYEEETAPVLQHYPADTIVDIDSIGSPARILHDILDHAVPQQDSHFKAFEG
ncbi:adenylate kinase family protein [Algisphaera agarilytica]|uniref:Adenylate kinase n=1 Tax=Algisphaera agarilytica TaxID=1385975 RepID=A0A7X0H6B8_9BACT|nr:nucleoside monophosphate kinase [Algisphaera agarilytica]MBB6429862.1 adenylate kinase [Algisphaera agarilytica]